MILFNVLLLISIGSVCSMPADRKDEKTEVTEANSEKEVTTEASKFKAYLKKYGDKDAKFNEKGYQRKSEDQGDDGYKHFDSFHKKNNDRYGYESHSSFGKSKKAEAQGGDAQIKYNDKDPKESAESRYYFDVVDPWHNHHRIPHFDIERIASLFHKSNHDAHEYIHSHDGEPYYDHDHDHKIHYHHGYKHDHDLYSDDHDHYFKHEGEHEYEHPPQDDDHEYEHPPQDDDHEYDHHPKYKHEHVHYHPDRHHFSEHKHQEHDKPPESEDVHECDHHPDDSDHTEHDDNIGYNDDSDHPPDDKNDQGHNDPHAIKDDHHGSYFDREQFFRDIFNRGKHDDSKEESGDNGKAPDDNKGSEVDFADEEKDGDDNGKSDNH